MTLLEGSNAVFDSVRALKYPGHFLLSLLFELQAQNRLQSQRETCALGMNGFTFGILAKGIYLASD